MRLIEHKDAKDLEQTFFSQNGIAVGTVNETHCLVAAEKKYFLGSQASKALGADAKKQASQFRVSLNKW